MNNIKDRIKSIEKTMKDFNVAVDGIIEMVLKLKEEVKEIKNKKNEKKT